MLSECKCKIHYLNLQLAVTRNIILTPISASTLVHFTFHIKICHKLWLLLHGKTGRSPKDNGSQIKSLPISYFSYCCDKTLLKNNLMIEKFILSCILRSSMTMEAGGN